MSAAPIFFTVEPWTEFQASANEVVIVGANGYRIATVVFGADANESVNRANIDRIVTAINALAGIADPAGFVARAKAAGVLS